MYSTYATFTYSLDTSVLVKDKKKYGNVSIITGRMETKIFYIINLS